MVRVKGFEPLRRKTPDPKTLLNNFINGLTMRLFRHLRITLIALNRIETYQIFCGGVKVGSNCYTRLVSFDTMSFSMSGIIWL
jgi:hypothetical protein